MCRKSLTGPALILCDGNKTYPEQDENCRKNNPAIGFYGVFFSAAAEGSTTVKTVSRSGSISWDVPYFSKAALQKRLGTFSGGSCRKIVFLILFAEGSGRNVEAGLESLGEMIAVGKTEMVGNL